MNYIKAIKAKEDGKDVIFEGRACDVDNPHLERRGNEIGLNVNGSFRYVPIGCINQNCWEIYEEPNFILADKVYGKTPLFKEPIISVEDIKTFIKKIKEDVEKENISGYLNNIIRIIDKRAGKL